MGGAEDTSQHSSGHHSLERMFTGKEDLEKDQMSSGKCLDTPGGQREKETSQGQEPPIAAAP